MTHHANINTRCIGISKSVKISPGQENHKSYLLVIVCHGEALVLKDWRNKFLHPPWTRLYQAPWSSFPSPCVQQSTDTVLSPLPSGQTHISCPQFQSTAQKFLNFRVGACVTRQSEGYGTLPRVGRVGRLKPTNRFYLLVPFNILFNVLHSNLDVR